MTIDDKLPSVAGELLYSHTLENDEHWMCVMEKAYAKWVAFEMIGGLGY